MTDYKELIKGMMGKKRFIHSCNVADMCVKLAEIHGGDTEKAWLAGILHDIRKEADDETLKKEMELSGYYIDPVELASRKTWHGIAAAYYVREVLEITDTDILNSIRFHTVGRADMSKLEKIVYLGDLVSAERSYPDVEKYRKYAFENLDKGMYKALEWLIPDFIKNGRAIPVSTLDAYNCYLSEVNKN